MPKLDHLERDLPSKRLLLLGHINHTATALANLLQQFVATNPVSGFFKGRRVAADHAGRLWLESVLFVMLEQRLHSQTNRGIIRARAIQESGAFFGPIRS